MERGPETTLRLRDAGALTALVLLLAGQVQAGPLDEMSLERWAKLREVERYQLNIAEKYFAGSQWKVAADEYEKYLKLYEKSVGASYAQLKWSLCQIHLRNLNTAIKDGFQSVIDYYPDSPEAVSSAFLIGRTYRDMGDLKAAKKAYLKLLSDHPKHYVAVLARVDLVDVAEKEKEPARRAALLRELTYEVDRKGAANADCLHAARQLAHYHFSDGNFAEGLKALATTCNEDALPNQLMHPQLGNLPNSLGWLTGQMAAELKKKGEKLADEAVVWMRNQATEGLKDEKKKVRAIQCWNHVAEIQAAAHRPEKQREVYEQMIASLGESDVLLGKLALCYKTNKQYDKARATYLRYKDAIQGHNQIAISLREEKKFDQAIEAFRKLSVQDDKNRATWMKQVALTYRQSGKPDQAIAVYRELINSDIKNAPEYHWEIAATLDKAQRWAEAITAYRGTENFPLNYQRMAFANRKLKKYDEAITLYRQIMATPGHASSSLLEIARTHEEAGRKEDAIKTFKLVCDRFPKTTEGSTAHAHLNEKYKISVTLGGAKD